MSWALGMYKKTWVIFGMIRRYVCDTNAIIWYFDYVFRQESKLTRHVRSIIDRAFQKESDVRLIIPSLVFIEIQTKWTTSSELAAKIRYEVFSKIVDCENIEIREISEEILENVLRISLNLPGHDLHDKIILANALALNCPLFTSDSTIIDYAKRSTDINTLI